MEDLTRRFQPRGRGSLVRMGLSVLVLWGHYHGESNWQFATGPATLRIAGPAHQFNVQVGLFRRPESLDPHSHLQEEPAQLIHYGG